MNRGVTVSKAGDTLANNLSRGSVAFRRFGTKESRLILLCLEAHDLLEIDLYLFLIP